MWVVMGVAMMMPALVPMRSSYRRLVGGDTEGRLGAPTTVVGTVLRVAAQPAAASSHRR
jgi:predicted metal-binding membrane protein